jgi:predicted nucleic acid-binding protein
MYLLDTNIILELLLEQEKADEVEYFLRNTSLSQLCLSEFSLYTIGINLLRRQKSDSLLKMIEDMLIMGGVQLIRLKVGDMEKLVDFSKRFNLDFDDAYQYTLAEKYNLTLVSFDSDFDKTERGRKTPKEVTDGR